MKKISIVIAEEYKLLRESIETFLNKDERFEVLACTEDNISLLKIIKEHNPQIIVINFDLGAKLTSEVIQDILDISGSKVICISSFPSIIFANQIMRFGAMGYITKNSSVQELTFAVLEVSKGKKYLCPEVKNLLAEQLMGENIEPRDITLLLTQREMQIVNLIANGETSRIIADALGTSIKTIEVHRHNILKKLDIKNSSSLVNLFNSSSSLLFNSKINFK